jgi:hypothetical protein
MPWLVGLQGAQGQSYGEQSGATELCFCGGGGIFVKNMNNIQGLQGSCSHEK